MSFLGLTPSGMADSDFVGQIRRGKRFQSLGALGAIGSIVAFAVTKAIAGVGGTVSVVLGTVLAASLALVGWTLLWIKESKEPFQYTYSVGRFHPIPPQPEDSEPVSEDPLSWLAHDLKEKLSERVPRLSLLDEKAVAPADPDEGRSSHVHISGWYGFRKDGEDWEFEVVPQVRLGGVGAPARLARTIRFRLDSSSFVQPDGERTPRLTDEGYQMLFERVYWSVASQIYSQIQRGVEEKVRLLPRGSLRASAYIHEADDYADSNTLDAYAAAQQLYRRALEIYDVRYRARAASPWRKRAFRFLVDINLLRRRLRGALVQIWRRAGRREVMTACAELGFAKMLAGEWHLGWLCGIVRRDIYEATNFVDNAIDRLVNLPDDVPGQRETLFRAYVTQATIRLLLSDLPGAADALADAQRLLPTRASHDADYLFAAGMIEPDRLLSLRLFGKSIELDPTMERALFHWAEEYDEIWRRRPTLEPEVALDVDRGYKEVLTLDPGNLTAWARRGYLGWLLAADSGSGQAEKWRAHALSALRTGRQYKEVRRDASVAEIDWNMARLAAEAGNFTEAYAYYIDAVSARLADPRVEFEESFYLSPTKALVDRFIEYQEHVLEKAAQAEANPASSLRLIKSVKSFVLNDCGLAYKAHYERSGSQKSWNRALDAFTKAREENDAFVLPTHNLARLIHLFSEFPGTTPDEAKQALNDVIQLLREVLQREPEWAPARLLMVDAQVVLAEKLDLERERIIAQGRDEAAAHEAIKSRPAEELQEERFDCLAAAEEQLRRLLPHQRLRDDTKGTSLVDWTGTHVPALIASPAIDWTNDFDAFHVAALARWGRLLAATAPEAADLLCGKLRGTYSRGDVKLLEAHLRAATTLAARDPESKVATAIREECEPMLGRIVRTVLRQDPVRLLMLQAADWLPEDDRRDALDAALRADPSATTLIWIGDTQVEMNDRDWAIKTYERARGEGSESLAALAAVRLAGLLELEGDLDKAGDAYRTGAGSPDAPTAAKAIVGLARILRNKDQGETARAECLMAATSFEMALNIGSRLEEENVYDDALLVYQTAGDQVEDERERADLKILQALVLTRQEGPPDAEAEALLDELSEGAIEPARWQAALIHAQSLEESNPERATSYYRSALEESDPTAISIAALELARMMEASGEKEAAHTFQVEQARRNPVAAERIAEMKRQRGDEDAEGFLAEVNGVPAA